VVDGSDRFSDAVSRERRLRIAEGNADRAGCSGSRGKLMSIYPGDRAVLPLASLRCLRPPALVAVVPGSGHPGAVTGVVGTLQATEVVKRSSHRRSAQGKLLL